MSAKLHQALEGFSVSEDQLQKLRSNAVAKTNRQMAWTFPGLYLLAIMLAPFHKMWMIGTIGGAAILAIFFGGYRFFKDSPFTLRYVSSLCAGLFVVVYMIQLGGQPYSHFLYFLLLTLLLKYKSTRVLWPYMGVFTLLALVVIFTQEGGKFPLAHYFIDRNEISLELLISTALLGVVHFFLCNYLAKYLSLQDAEAFKKELFLERQLNIEENIDFAAKLAAGQLEATYAPHEDDKIGQSLLSLQKNLNEFVKKEEVTKWINEGVAKVSETLMRGERIEELSEKLLYELLDHLGAIQGTLFLIQDAKSTEEKVLFCAASNAIGNVEKREFALGEGLIGQAAKSRRTLQLSNPPEAYFKLNSGLGETVPKQLLIQPLVVKEELVGVLEVAFISEVEEYKIKYLEEIKERIAATFLALAARNRNSLLLQETQQYTQLMQAQEEQMRQSFEELQSTQEELAAQNYEAEATQKELQARIDIIESTALFMEITPEGKIERCNTQFAAHLGHTTNPEKTLYGKQIESILPEDERLGFFKNVCGQISDNQRFMVSLAFVGKHGELVWTDSTFTPLYNEAGKLERLFLISFDITAKIQHHQRLQQLLLEAHDAKAAAEEAQILLKEHNIALDNSVGLVELDVERNILFANERFMNLYGLEGSVKGHAIDELACADSSDGLRHNWSKVLSGALKEREFKRRTAKGSTIWVREFFTPIYEESGELKKIIALSYNVNDEKAREEENQKLLKKYEKLNAVLQVKEEALRKRMTELHKIKAQQFQRYEKLDQLLKTVPGAVFRGTVDEQGKIQPTVVTEGIEKLTGYSAEDFLEKRIHWEDLVLRDAASQAEYKAARKEAASHIKKQQVYEISYQIKHKDGHIREVQERGRGVYDEAHERLLFLEGFLAVPQATVISSSQSL